MQAMLAAPVRLFSPRSNKLSVEAALETGELPPTPSPDYTIENYHVLSERRQFPLRTGGKVFYVDMEKLANSSEYKNISWDRSIQPEVFRLILRIIDGDDCLLAAEDMPEVLRFGAHSRVTPVLQRCWDFMTNGGLQSMSVDLLLAVFDILDKEIRSCDYGRMGCAYVLKALLEHKEQNDMFNAMLMSSHKIVPYLKKGVKEIHKLQHRWKDQAGQGSCPCGKEKNNVFNRVLPHLGVICSYCLQKACRHCSTRLCPKNIANNLLAPLFTSSEPCSIPRLPPPPSPGMPLFSPERSTTPPITSDLPPTPPLAHSSPKSTPRQRSRRLFANKGVL